MPDEGNGVDKESAHTHHDEAMRFADHSIIQFGIFCCAITMVIVLAIAVAAP